MEAKYKEPIFYHNGDFSSFLDATKISKEGITLSPFNNLPDLKTLDIEFSFPKSDIVIKANTNVISSGRKLFLEFNKLDKKSKQFIQNYINSIKRSKTSSASAV